jgi:hypothetical protein
MWRHSAMDTDTRRSIAVLILINNAGNAFR